VKRTPANTMNSYDRLPLPKPTSNVIIAKTRQPTKMHKAINRITPIDAN